MEKKVDLRNKLYKECGLNSDDIFKSNHFTIITRSGIEKIQYLNEIIIIYEPVTMTENMVVIKAIGTRGAKTIETFGEWNITHAKKKQDGDIVPYYSVALAEKRAMSRVVLKLMNLYEYNVLGEDEEVFDMLDATYNQVQQIEDLLRTSTFGEDDKERLESELSGLSFERANEIITKLKNNQRDPIKSGDNYGQTQIRETKNV